MNSKLVRIYTEDLNRDEVLTVCNSYFSSYTVISASGVWEATPEKSLIIEFVIPEGPNSFTRLGYVRNIAAFIKANNYQDAVLITVSEVTAVVV